MKIVENLRQLPANLAYPVMAVGVFDGVHLGHQAILRQVVRLAREKTGTAIVLTFSPHPQKVISPDQAPLLLQTSWQKKVALQAFEIDILIRLPFTRRLSLYSPEQFARHVLADRGILEIHVGENFRFGHRRSGDFKILDSLGRELGFRVSSIAPVMFRNHRVSSTGIRRLLSSGQVAAARRFLGRPHQVCGTVVRGAGRGRQLGFPTANLSLENELIPAVGVYLTRTHLGPATFSSITNVGYRPTVQEPPQAHPIVETYLCDFEADLYGERLCVDFCSRLRGERKFDSVGALRRQIARDAGRARAYRLRLEGREKGSESP